MKYYEPFMKLSQTLRIHVGLAALSWNALVPLKQFPSLFLALGRVPVGQLLKSSGRLLTMGMDLVKKVHELDPYMSAMDYDPIMGEIRMARKNKYEQMVAKYGETGMKGIFVVDKAVKIIIWDAVYNHHISKGDAPEEAVHEARRAIIETQPGGFLHDLPTVARQNEFFKWMTLFTSQLQKLYNITAWDIPNAIRKGDVATGLQMMTGYIIAALLIGMINKKDLPEGGEEATWMIVEQFINSIPVAGPLVLQGTKGWAPRGTHVNEALNSIGNALGTIAGGAEDEKILQRTIRALEDVLFLSGLPAVQIKRMENLVRTGDPWEIVGGRQDD
jgi:hypothetical protein